MCLNNCMHISFHTKSLIVIHALFSIATDVIPFSFSAHTQSFNHINHGSPVCVLLSKTRWGNDVLKVSMNKDKKKRILLKEANVSTGALNLPVHYFGDYNQQCHSAVL